MADFEDLIGRIYEAAAVPHAWPSVLEELSGVVDGAFASILTRRNDDWMGWRISPDMAESGDIYMRSEAARRSRTTERLFATARPGFVADHELFTDEEYLSDPFMTEFGTPIGCHHGAATGIHTPSGDLAVVQVMRRRDLPQFSSEDLDRLDAYRPHLARAAMLAARWKLEQLRSAAEALYLVGLPAAIVDRAGRVLAANRLIEIMTDHVVWLPENRIALADKAASALLTQALSGLHDHPTQACLSFPARGRTGDPAVAHVVPTAGQGRDLFEGGLALLVVSPAQSSSADAALLRTLFDFTPAEARVAAGISQGLTIAMVAEAHGISIETVRSQLKSIFAKTGTARQTTLIAKLGAFHSTVHPNIR